MHGCRLANAGGGFHSSGSITIYPSTAINLGGDIGPLATIVGARTELETPVGLAVDSSGNIHACSRDGFSVTFNPPLNNTTGNLNEAPIAAFDAGIGPTGVALGLFMP